MTAKQLALGKPVRKQNQCSEEQNDHCNHSPLFSGFMQVEFLHRQRIFLRFNNAGNGLNTHGVGLYKRAYNQLIMNYGLLIHRFAGFVRSL
jgi:hypothetical protein